MIKTAFTPPPIRPAADNNVLTMHMRGHVNWNLVLAMALPPRPPPLPSPLIPLLRPPPPTPLAHCFGAGGAE